MDRRKRDLKAIQAFWLENPRRHTHADFGFTESIERVPTEYGFMLRKDYRSYHGVDAIAWNWVVLRSRSSRDPIAMSRPRDHRHRGRPRRPLSGILPGNLYGYDIRKPAPKRGQARRRVRRTARHIERLCTFAVTSSGASTAFGVLD